MYRVRDNQREATLIIVIRVLGLKRRVTRVQRARAAYTGAVCVDASYARRRLQRRRGRFHTHVCMCVCEYVQRLYVHAREMQRTICAAAYESICRGLYARRARTAAACHG